MVNVNGKNYGVIQKASKFKAFAQRIIASGDDFGFDIEAGYTGEDKKGVALKTHHPDWLFVGFSFTNSLEWARYVPVNHDDESVNIDDPVETARWLWKMLWTGNGVAHNALYELNGLSRWFRETLSDDEELGEEVSRNLGLFPVKSDTMVQAHQVAYYDPVTVGVGLKSLVKHVFGHEMTVFEDLFGELKPAEKKFLRFNVLGITDGAVEYACEDAVWCLALHKLHYDDVKGSVIEDAETGLLPVLARMEMEGLVLNWDLVDAKLKEAEEFRDKMAEEIFTSLSERLDEVVQFNLNSTAQLAEILFNRLGIKPKMKSKTTGKPSTSEKALRLVAQSDPIVRRILEYREVVKLIGSYLKKYKNELNYAGNQRAYPNHKSVGALTGRFSVDGVSYQQWPKPYFYKLADGTEFHMSFRDLLLSPENHRIVGYDFSQVELRVMAGLANEKVMIEAFNNGEDIHRLTYSRMTGKPLDQVTKAERAVGKTLSFATVYGSGPSNIAEMISTPEKPVTTEDAEKLLKQYYEAYPALATWMAERRYEGRTTGNVYTPFGRKFHVWEYLSDKKFIQEKGDRMCVNAPVQGGAADIMKIGMVRAQRAIDKAGLSDKIKMVMTIHDALEFYVHESVDTQTVIDLVSPATSFPIPGMPEIKADWHEGKTMGTFVEINLDKNRKIKSYSIDGDDWKGMEWDTYEEAEYYLHHPEEVVREEKTRDGHTTVVTLTEMPTKSQWTEFRKLLGERPGPDKLVVNTPQGTINPQDGMSYDLPTDVFNKISSIFGGAHVKVL